MADEQDAQGAPEEETSEAEGEQQEQQNVDALTKEQVEELLQERDRKWQSRFDKLLQEKKQQEEATEREKMSAEEKIEQLRQEWERSKQEAARARLENRAQAAIAEAGIPSPPRLSAYVGETEDETDELVGNYVDWYKQQVAQQELEKAKANGRKPRSANKLETMTFDDLNEMTRKEVEAFAREHPDVFDRLTGR
jgi:hypothetical protein